MAPREARIREHFLAPRNVGALPAPSRLGRAENQVCGDVLELYLRVEGGRVTAASHVTEGCAAVCATASLVTSAVVGTALAEAAALDVAHLVAAAGGLPPTKSHAPRLVQRALREALAQPGSP